jgi:hypothetical protein
MHSKFNEISWKYFLWVKDDPQKTWKFFIKYSRGSEFIPNTVPYFLSKILRFSAKKFKSANRTVVKIKTALGVLIDLFQKREPFSDYLKGLTFQQILKTLHYNTFHFLTHF